MNSFEQRQEAKRKRLEAAADRAASRATDAFKRGDMSEASTGIPFGQPILVGHHSEGRHRAAIKRADNAMRRGVEESDKASRLRGKAASVGTGGISSDDPDAITKLREKLATKVKNQEMMKAVNKAIRKKDDDGLRALGLSAAQIEKLKEPDFGGRVGFAPYALTNNNREIARLRKRIEQLEKAAEAEEKDEQHEGFRVVENVEDNRVQFFFDGKPSAEVRDIMKGEAFRWARSVGAWQRQLSNPGRYAAGRAVKQIAALTSKGAIE